MGKFKIGDVVYHIKTKKKMIVREASELVDDWYGCEYKINKTGETTHDEFSGDILTREKPN